MRENERPRLTAKNITVDNCTPQHTLQIPVKIINDPTALPSYPSEGR